MNNEIRIALTNLGQYNEGKLNFVWLALPATEDEITKALEAIDIDGERYEEYFITDYEAPFKIGEYDNLDGLNEIAEAYDDLDEDERAVVEAYMENLYDDFEEAVGAVTSGEYRIWYGCDDMEDVAIEMVNEGYFGGVPEGSLSTYIDYKAIGRDLRLEGDFFETAQGIIEFYS